MAGGTISRAILNPEESQQLVKFLDKHRIYPYKFKFNKTINNTNFNKVDSAGGGRYFTLSWAPSFYTGIVYFGANWIVTPNSTVGNFSATVSYASTISFADNASPTAIDLEGTDALTILSAGSTLNELVPFFPLNWSIETGKTIYVHVWADTTTCSAGTSSIIGQFTFGTLVTSRQ